MRVPIAYSIIVQFGLFGISKVFKCVFCRYIIGENDISTFANSSAVLYAYYSVIVV